MRVEFREMVQKIAWHFAGTLAGGESAKEFIANRRALLALVHQSAEGSPPKPGANFEELASRECHLR